MLNAPKEKYMKLKPYTSAGLKRTGVFPRMPSTAMWPCSNAEPWVPVLTSEFSEPSVLAARPSLVLLQRVYEGAGTASGTDQEPQCSRGVWERCLVQALRFNPSNSDATRELRRLEGKTPGGGAAKKKGFFGKLFGGKKK